jgi:hypothetical protein
VGRIEDGDCRIGDWKLEIWGLIGRLKLAIEDWIED